MAIHKKSGMYLCERAGSMARWDIKKEEAMKELKEWWDANLNPDIKKHLRFEKVDE